MLVIGAAGGRGMQGAGWCTGWADPQSRVNNASTGGLHIGPMVTLTGGEGGGLLIYFQLRTNQMNLQIV